MRYTVTKQVIQVIGKLWMPGVTAATEMTLRTYDMENIEDPRDRDSVEHWLMLHSGDFSEVLDFRADFTIDGKDIIHEWADPESEYTFADCMYPEPDDE